MRKMLVGKKREEKVPAGLRNTVKAGLDNRSKLPGPVERLGTG